MSLYRVWLPTLDGVTLVVLEADGAAEMSRRAPTERMPELVTIEKRRPVKDERGKLRFEIEVLEVRPQPYEVAMELRLARGAVPHV